MKLKNYFFYAAFLALSASGISQTIFSENFNGGNSFQNWTLINADNRVPAANIAWVNNAWVITPDSSSADLAAISTSWYTPVGAADDYMITPAIYLNAGSILSFQANAPDASVLDGYEVRISNTTPTVAGLLANPALFAITAENSVWTDRNIDLSAYGTDTVYLAWRNVTNDGYVVFVDNIKVYTPTNVGVDEQELVENSLVISPNPADDHAVIAFELVNADQVSMTILDITGKVISVQDYGVMNQGNQRIELNTSSLSEGLYFVNVRIGENHITRKVAVK